MTEGKGKCRHGEFDLNEGCPQCMAERREARADDLSIVPLDEVAAVIDPKLVEEPAVAGAPRYIVQVRYGAEATEGRLYSYYSEEPLKVGDLVEAPAKNGPIKARVIAIGITEAEIANFKDAMRTIPAGAVIRELTAAPVLDRMVNLCDTCKYQPEYPVCSPSDVEFGDGVGNDNIIACHKYEIRPELEEMEDGLNQEGLTLVGAEEPVVKTALVTMPGADHEVISYYQLGMSLNLKLNPLKG